MRINEFIDAVAHTIYSLHCVVISDLPTYKVKRINWAHSAHEMIKIYNQLDARHKNMLTINLNWDTFVYKKNHFACKN